MPIKVERDTVYRPGEAAEVLGCHRRTIMRHIRGGELRGTKRGARWFIAGEDLADFLRGATPSFRTPELAPILPELKALPEIPFEGLRLPELASDLKDIIPPGVGEDNAERRPT